MISLLFIHIFVALVTVAVSAMGLVMAWRRSNALRAAMITLWSSFVATAVTGVALVTVLPQTLAHTCVMMSVYVVVVTAVHVYARRRASVPIDIQR